MTSSQGMRKKEDLAAVISSLLDQAARTRRGFTPEVLQEFYDEGLRAQQREQPERRGERIREATPSRQLGRVVARRTEEPEQRTSISPHMTQRAIESAVDLGERLELAALRGRRLSLRSWVTG